VDLVLHRFQTNIDASTGDGHISLASPSPWRETFAIRRFTAKMTVAAQPLTIHTGDGSIRLSKS